MDRIDSSISRPAAGIAGLTRRDALALAGSGLVLPALIAPAQAELVIDLRKGTFQPMPIAVADFDRVVNEYAAMVAENAPLTVAAAKRTLAEIMKDPAERDLDAVRRMIDACFASEDYREGRTAFMEKRRPAFRGR